MVIGRGVMSCPESGRMSASGHKLPRPAQILMSAFTPITDTAKLHLDVRYGPQAVIRPHRDQLWERMPEVTLRTVKRCGRKRRGGRWGLHALRRAPPCLCVDLPLLAVL
jgi:hypothetical protein